MAYNCSLPISDEARKRIGERQKDHPEDLFTQAQEEVYQVLEKVWFPKFMTSDAWRREFCKMVYPEMEFDPDELQQVLFLQVRRLCLKGSQNLFPPFLSPSLVG